MELSDIKKLSSILHENGDKILDGSSKLSMSINLLQYLNESFNLIVDDHKDFTGNSTFQVINSSNSRLEIFRDLQFLHDFIQKTIGLKIGVGTVTEVFEGTADISKFRSLKLLEIRKIPVQFISGIKHVRSQLHFLICVKCLNTLDELLIQCGADKSVGFTWNELREASFSYNNLKIIDYSIKFVPFLQMLDLSHNRLTDAQPLDCLHNLKYLNLSYNLLERLPNFTQEQSRKLLSLIIKNNYIEDLTGLISLISLRELDVSNNCLIDHTSLSVIPMLANLQELSLEGNPLSYHPYHRKLTCRYLHSNTASVKFLLDHLLLTKSEKLQIGTYHTNSVRLTMQGKSSYNNSSLTSSVRSESQTSNQPSTPTIPELTRTRTRKMGRVREPIISDQNSTIDATNDKPTNDEHNLSKSASSLEASVEHLETKKQIEGLREKYGEFWLHSKGGSLLVQDVLGMERTPIPVTASSPYLDVTREIRKGSESSLSNSPNSLRTLIPEGDSMITATENATVYETAQESAILSENETMNEIFKSYEKTDEDGDVVEEQKRDETQDEVEEDENSKIYLAQLQRDATNVDELLLCVNLENKLIRERDATTGKIREQWPLSMLESCEKTTKGVFLKFDTVKRSKQTRDYSIYDADDIQNLIDVLRDVLDARSLTEMNQVVYRCLRCSTQFTQERNDKMLIISKDGNGSTTLKCPSCQSTIVMEEEDIKPVKPLVSTRDLTPERAEIALPHSPSPSSIAYDNQTTGASPRLLKVTADVHTPAASYPQVNTSLLQPHCSATSLNESTCSKSDSVTKRGDSDIEVLSDPSQDSIEVLAVLARGSSVTPKRRRSSEERRVEITTPSTVTNLNSEQKPTIVIAPPPSTTSATINPPVGLTESSSSDSLTDSVCTAYEKQNLKAQLATSGTVEENILPENTELEISVDEPKTAETVGIFSSMLDGALISKFYSELIAISSPSKNTNSSAAAVLSKVTSDIVEFSYTDFMQVDHRVKLFLYLNIFEDETEELVWLLRAEILPYNCEQVFSGCVVLSTKKVYILKIDGNIVGDEPQTWLHKYEAYTVDRLQTVFTLPWKQGVGLEIRQSSLISSETSFNILCFLQDITRTSNFLYHLGKGTLPDTCELNTKMSERTSLNIQQLMLSNSSQSDGDLSVCLLHVFSACQIQSSGEDVKQLNMGVLLITNCDLILTQDSLTWLQPESIKTPTVYTAQQISNLVEVECGDYVLTLNFLMENEGKAETWNLVTVTKHSIDQIIAAIRDPWEKLFSVSLQVNEKATLIAPT